MTILLLSLISGGVALLFAIGLVMYILRQDQGDETMQEIAKAIQEGAMAFLAREYAVLSLFVAIIFAVLWVFIDADVLGKIADPSRDLPSTAISYLAGAVASGLAGLIGMSVAVRANVRTTASAREGLSPALRVAFSSGAVMGITVVGLGIIGVTALYLTFKDPIVIAGFSFGASSVALFARVGGGIYTKAADVGADIVGKVEQGIPEDDPRNPATIADNVGDNVGDVAGMGADLFESYVGSIIATMALASVAGVVFADFDADNYKHEAFLLPLLIATIGIFSSILGTFLVRTSEGASMGRLLWALRIGIFSTGGMVLIGTGIAISVLDLDFNLFWAVLVGLAAGQVIGTATEWFTSYEYFPTRWLSKQTLTGAGTVIIGGMGLGMLSTLIPVVSIVVAIWLANWLAGLYGIAIAAVGMLSTLGITLATDAYGPVADNAGGIAEQAHLPPEVRERTDALDSLGNTTAATGKGFAIGSAVLTSLALMAAYSQVVGIDIINIREPSILIGLLVGALMPFIFSALSLGAVGRAANSMVAEVRRQFREIPGIMEGTARPEYGKAVAISTQGALREMILPGLLAIIAPILMGAIMGAEALGGLLIGSIASGVLLAITMANAGGAWDNAKKYVEKGELKDELGETKGKGSAEHAAAVVGDTVGDPFKDTSGPSLNILLKLMSIVALVFGPLFV